MRKFRFMAASAVFAGAALVTSSAGGTTAGTKHYPDLRTRPPSDIGITRQCSFLLLGSCKTLLRFSNTVWNAGDGRLEMPPQNNSSTGKTNAYQRVYTHDASGKWKLAEELPVGEFVFHSSRNHWHFEGFANYSLINENADGSIGNNVQRSSQKTTFCVIDTHRVNPNLQHSGAQTYTACGQTDITGLTVGWGDKYGHTLPGQSIDISHLPDGRYWLYSVADYKNKLAETRDDNNWAAVKLQIRGTTVTVLETKLAP